MRWPKPSWRLSICAEVATGWEIWELIETKQDSKGSHSEQGEMLFSAFAFLSDGPSHEVSIVWLSQFETPFTLSWKIHFMEEVQANPPQSPSVLAGWSWQQLADLDSHSDK